MVTVLFLSVLRSYFIGTGEHTGHTLHANLHIPELDFSNEIMSLLTANPILKHAAQMIGGMKQLPYSTGVRATVRFPGFNYKYPREQVTWEEISMENRDHFYHVDGTVCTRSHILHSHSAFIFFLKLTNE